MLTPIEPRRWSTLSSLQRRRLQDKIGAPTQQNPTSTIGRRTDRGSAPLSLAQERLWILEQLGNSGAAYHMSASVEFSGPLDLGLLEQTFAALVERHESLRTRFVNTDGRPMQVVEPPYAYRLAVEDLTDIPDAEREKIVVQRVEALVHAPFNLEKGRLLRASVLGISTDQHIVTVVAHHIIADGWSVAILIREIKALYDGLATGSRSSLPAAAIGYSDYATWQRGWMHSELAGKQLAYWRNKLADAPTTELATDRQRPPMQSFRGGRLVLRLPEALTTSLVKLARAEAVSPFMLLLAVFKLVLSRWTGQTDIVVGTPIAGRGLSELQDVVGLFVNKLALRTSLSGDPSFRSLLKRVKETALGAYANQDLPFEELIDDLHPVRDLSRHPLFQILINSVDVTSAEVELSGTRGKFVHGGESGAKFDLTLYTLMSAELSLVFVYNADLFRSETVERFADHFREAAAKVVSDPERPLSRLSILAEGESAIHSFVPRAYPAGPDVFTKFEAGEPSLIARFEKQVAAAPHNLAVTDGKLSWTYEQLNRHANGVAEVLLSKIGSGEHRVALLFGHGVEMIAAILGTLKAGKTYVPLDPTNPIDRLKIILADASASAVLCGSEHLGVAQACTDQDRVQLLDSWRPLAGDRPHLRTPQSISYVLYTSGTTGQPKGVVQCDDNVLHFIAAYTNALRICRRDRLALFAAYGFDAAVMDIFGALLNGASLHVRDLRGAGFHDLESWTTGNGITIWHSTPTVYRLAAKFIVGGSASQLRHVVLGGEEALPSDVALLPNFGRNCTLVNGYGPTESTVTLQFIVQATGTDAESRLPVGFPVQDTTVLLVDGNGSPADVTGEIAILASHAALGYLNRPGLTAERFVPAPFGNGERLYLTGDLGRWRHDGALEYLGRADQQVKVRGFRIEPAEIEAALLSHDGVRQSVVIARQRADEKQLLAYAVVEDGAIDGARLRSHLKARLPDYMVPSAIVVVEALPLLRNGKVDRAALPEPGERAYALSEYVKPRTAVEEVIAQVWRDVLGRSRVGAQDNFFDLGGTSIMLVQAHAALVQALGRQVPITLLFQFPTVSALAAGLEGTHDTVNSARPVAQRGEARRQFALQRQRRQFRQPSH